MALRFLTGVGQAGFLSLAPAMVGHSAPSSRSSLYIGVYFMALYVGSGIGMLLGGRFSSWDTSCWAYGGFASLMGLALVVFAACRNRFMCPSASSDEPQSSTKKRSMMKLVYQRKAFWMLAIGYGFFIFFVGGVAFWGPSMLQEMYGVDKQDASWKFGLATGATGIIGTIVGGQLVDFFFNRYKSDNMSPDAVRCYLGTRISAILTLAALPFIFMAPFTDGMTKFMLMMSPGMLLLFTTTAPCNIAIMNSVPEGARGQAIALSVTISHILGDIPSPVAIGWLKDQWDNKPTANMNSLLIANAFIGLSGLVWLVGARVAYREGMRFFVGPSEV
jgi:sugar phosphate permease